MILVLKIVFFFFFERGVTYCVNNIIDYSFREKKPAYVACDDETVNDTDENNFIETFENKILKKYLLL